MRPEASRGATLCPRAERNRASACLRDRDCNAIPLSGEVVNQFAGTWREIESKRQLGSGWV